MVFNECCSILGFVSVGWSAVIVLGIAHDLEDR